MKNRLVLLVVGLACMAALPAATATAAKPDLCEHSCGGSWGAYEHAKATAENKTGQSATVEWCHEINEGSAQWKCQGYTANWTWNIKLSAYGYTEEWNAYYR